MEKGPPAAGEPARAQFQVQPGVRRRATQIRFPGVVARRGHGEAEKRASGLGAHLLAQFLQGRLDAVPGEGKAAAAAARDAPAALVQQTRHRRQAKWWRALPISRNESQALGGPARRRAAGDRGAESLPGRA